MQTDFPFLYCNATNDVKTEVFILQTTVRVYMKLSNIWLYASLLGSVFKQSAVEMRAVKRDKNLSLFKVPANFKHTYKTKLLTPI